MKSNFFKIVLPAFALMLAITASLAFTADDAPVTINSGDSVYYKVGTTVHQVPQLTVNAAAPITCETVTTGVPCTLIVESVTRQISVESDFSVLLWKIEE